MPWLQEEHCCQVCATGYGAGTLPRSASAAASGLIARGIPLPPFAEMDVVVQTVWDPTLGVGEFTTHFRTYFSGDWDVHWGYDLDLTHLLE